MEDVKVAVTPIDGNFEALKKKKVHPGKFVPAQNVKPVNRHLF